MTNILICVIRTKWLDRDVEQFVLRYYHKDTYKTCYSYMISPINGQDKWPKTINPRILPLTHKCQADRPKKLRRREPYEDHNPNKPSKTNTIMTCRRCHERGHNINIRTCKVPLPPKPEVDINANDGNIQNNEGNLYGVNGTT